MGATMNRGKRQVLLNYLPGRTFDFSGLGTIAMVTTIRGIPNTEINADLLLQAVQQYANAWDEEYRPLLPMPVSPARNPNPERFVLLDPKGVQAEMFPLVFHCQDNSCRAIISYSNRGSIPTDRTCPRCRKQKLTQLRFIKIHRCGEIQPLAPYCSSCKTGNYITLDTRGSERFGGFQWICRNCNTKPFPGSYCRACNWGEISGNQQEQRMDIEVHRAGRTYYPHYVVLLNQPSREMDAFLQLSEWPLLAGAAYLELPEIQTRQLLNFGASTLSNVQANVALTNDDLDAILARFRSGEISAEQMASEMEASRKQRNQQQSAAKPSGIAAALVRRTGIGEVTWQLAGREMLEAVLPLQSGTTQELFDLSPTEEISSRETARQIARECGFSRVTAVSDFPITTATFGYSRVDYQPNRCRLNLFPAEREHGGRFPIYVDLVQADAVVLRLNHDRVYRWLVRNGFAPPPLPSSATDQNLARQAYFVQLFDEVQPAVTIRSEQPHARMVFGLLHTMSHLCIRQAALLCGLDRTSLSEYVLPRALSFALYCNHRFGATIGALTSLFEQTLEEWLGQVRDARRCVYDPVCSAQGGSCHACAHLAETSCRFFNLNLSRAFLFGGTDAELNEISIGYFDPSL